MKMQTIRIIAGAETQIHGGIKKLVVQRASASFGIETHEAEQYTARAGDKITFEKHARTVRLINKSETDILVTLVIIYSHEGDLENSAGAVEVTNAIRIQGCEGRRIKTFEVKRDSRTRVLENLPTRSRALIQTTGKVHLFTATTSKEFFELDGDMDEHSTSALYATAADEYSPVIVRVMEYLT